MFLPCLAMSCQKGIALQLNESRICAEWRFCVEGEVRPTTEAEQEQTRRGLCQSRNRSPRLRNPQKAVTQTRTLGYRADG